MKQAESSSYPRLTSFLSLKNQNLKAAYTVQDVAGMFDVTSRTIQSWIATGRLNKRTIPGRAKIFPVDLELLLAASEPAAPQLNRIVSQLHASPFNPQSQKQNTMFSECRTVARTR